jgi:hypothetical protein
MRIGARGRTAQATSPYVKVQAPFGFVTGCHAGDKFMVQATLASIRYFCADVPICLTVDGDFDVSDLEREYDLIVLRVPALSSATMRNLLSGSGRAKLAAMWEGPFEFFVWLDSDAIVWGDFIFEVRTDVDFQIFWSEISIPADATEIPPWLPHFYFDPSKLKRFDPAFDWRGHAYFSSGAFGCRRDAIPLEKWLDAELWGQQTPGLFGDFYEQPILNYLVHSMRQRGELKVIISNLQHISEHHGVHELKQDCADSSWHFPAKIRRPRVAHFCGHKPFLSDRDSYSRPFTIARLEHHRRQHGEVGAWLEVVSEEWRLLSGKFQRRFPGAARRACGR